MSNFELIDDFLTNRLGEQEKILFEQQLKSDPILKADVDLQKHILEGVKKARITELKTMLNNVPISSALSAGLSTGKIAALMGTAAIVGTGLYFYLKPQELKNESLPVTERHVAELPSLEAEAIKPLDQKTESTTSEKETVVIKPEIKKEIVSSSTSSQPKIEVVDPSEEFNQNSSSEILKPENNNSSVTNSHIEVEMDSSNKMYFFHYQFEQGKLLLYGSFDKGLYEILEINGDKKSVFLFYKGNYFLLDEKQNKIKLLEPIKDGGLVKKLNEYRTQ